MDDPITPSAIAETALRIAPFVRRTPVLEVSGTDAGCGAASVALKLESLQHSGSFKTRGAFANLVGRAIPSAGVVAASGGNHGAAVAYAARALGVPATIFIPETSSPAKIARIRAYGARLEVHGSRYADALEACDAWCARSDALALHAFDQPGTLLGQGTLARELEEQAPRLDTVLVAVGGGGLIGGVAAWYAGRVRIIAVEPEDAPTLAHAFEAGQPVDAPAGGIAADSLAPRRVGERPFAIARQFVERVVLVDDEAIRAAQHALWERFRIVAEPGGAAAFGALRSGRYQPEPGERIGAIVCGGNTVAVDFDR